MRLEELQDVGLLLISLFKPNEGLVVVFESEIGIYEGASGDLVRLAALLQFSEHAERIGAPASFGISSNQHAYGTRTAVHQRDRFLEFSYGLLRVADVDQDKTKIPVAYGFVGVYGQVTTQGRTHSAVGVCAFPAACRR